jgi:DNA-binding Xre family transcriptional regulator
MGVSYNKLFKLMIDRKMKKKDLREAAGLSSSSVTKLANDEYVSMDVLVKVCTALHVDFGDIMEIVHEE